MMTMQRFRSSADQPNGPPAPPWLAGAAIGLTILTMAAGAMTLGTAWAFGQATLPKQGGKA
jgi:hypothetical protein